jgi:hypothetical protein
MTVFNWPLAGQVLLGIGQWVDEMTSSKNDNNRNLLSDIHPYNTDQVVSASYGGYYPSPRDWLLRGQGQSIQHRVLAVANNHSFTNTNNSQTRVANRTSWEINIDYLKETSPSAVPFPNKPIVG